MRFLSIYKTVERSAPPTPEEMAKMGKLVEDGMKAGFLLAVEGCLPSASGRSRSPLQRQADCDRWAFHRNQGGDRRPRPPSGELEGRGYRTGQAIPQRSG